ncbi:MAG: MBL fold metallo-hydrolase [Solirubrobacteraceae bacterium]
MSEITITHIGGPTALLEIGGWRLLTDPTFDPPGKRYFFGWGTVSRKLTGPALQPDELGEIDAVLLSHDHHGDNLDPAGRAMLASAAKIITTAPGARRLARKNPELDGRVTGLEPWGQTVLESTGRPSIEITATPCRHGPPGTHPIVGDVIGFSLRFDGQQHGAVWISGDSVLYDGLREVPTRIDVGTAILHLGGVTFPWLMGPLRFTMNAEEAVELSGLLNPATIVPIHYEGWQHFRQTSEQARAVLDSSPLGERVRWLTPGTPAGIEV